jgi:hypothetical protein
MGMLGPLPLSRFPTLDRLNLHQGKQGTHETTVEPYSEDPRSS